MQQIAQIILCTKVQLNIILLSINQFGIALNKVSFVSIAMFCEYRKVCSYKLFCEKRLKGT